MLPASLSGLQSFAQVAPGFIVFQRSTAEADTLPQDRQSSHRQRRYCRPFHLAIWFSPRNMVFTSRRRSAPHLTPPTGRLPRAVGTKLGERCQHKYHCWFRHQCRGWHPELEQQHFADCEASATKLEAPYCAAGVCTREGCTGLHNVQNTRAQNTGAEQECQRTEQEDVFYDTILAPRRRRHRRMRKKQRARMRRNKRVEFKVFRRAQRGVDIQAQSRNVMIQTQSELYSKAKGTQTQHYTAGNGTTSTGERRR